MDDQHAPVVTVGVDGRPDNLAALRFAAAEARSLDAALRLVHVVPDFLAISPMIPQSPVDLGRVGAAILDEARALLSETDSDLAVETCLRHGGRAVQLAEAAADTALLVVGRDDRPLLERLWRGDTATGVAARAAVPVVEVPAEWQASRHGTVIAGVKSPKHAPELLAAAFETAQRRRARLLVLHAWKLPSGYDDIIEARVDLEALHQEATVDLERLVGDWRTAYPTVPVELRIVHDHAGHALVEASGAADIMVLVRRQHGVPPSAHLGGTARAVLRTSRCPVQVVAPSAEPPVPPLVLEREGGLAR